MVIHTWLSLEIIYFFGDTFGNCNTEPLRVTENPMQLGIVLEFFLNPENLLNFPKAKFALKLGIRTGKSLKSLKLENPNWQKPKIT